MTADTPLATAAQAKHEHTRQRALDALDALQDSGNAISISALARTAQVARSWIYTQPDILERVKALAGQHEYPPRRHITPASDESWQRRLTAAHQRIRDLAAENNDLRAQLAAAYGQLRNQHGPS